MDSKRSLSAPHLAQFEELMTTLYPPSPTATPSQRQVSTTQQNPGLLLGILSEGSPSSCEYLMKRKPGTRRYSLSLVTTVTPHNISYARSSSLDRLYTPLDHPISTRGAYEFESDQDIKGMEVGGTIFITVHPSLPESELQRNPWFHSSSG